MDECNEMASTKNDLVLQRKNDTLTISQWLSDKPFHIKLVKLTTFWGPISYYLLVGLARLYVFSPNELMKHSVPHHLRV